MWKKRGVGLLFASLGLGLYALINGWLFESVDNVKINIFFKSIVGVICFLVPLLTILFSLLVVLGKKTNWSTLLKAGGLYLLSRIFHFLIVLTKNVNDKDFKLDGQLVFKIFVDWNIVAYVGFLIFLFFVFSRMKRFKTSLYDSWFSGFFDLKEEQVLTALFSLFIYLSPEIFSLLKAKFYYLNPLNNIDLIAVDRFTLLDFLNLTLREIFLFLVVVVVASSFVKGINGFSRNHVNWQLAFASSIFLAINANYLIQLSLANYTKIVGYSVLDGASLFQILTLFLIYYLIYLLVNRYIYASSLIIMLTGLLVFSNIEKFGLRGEPVYLTDFTWLKNFKSLISFINGGRIIGMFIVLLLVVGLTIFLQTKFLRGRVFQRKRKRIVLLAASIFCLWLIGDNTRKNPHLKVAVLSDFSKWQDGNILWLGNTPTANMKSLSFVWYRQLFTDPMDEPEGYSQKAVMEIRDRYIKRAEELNQSRKENIGDKTVIFVLSESLANPNRIPQVKLSQNPLPEIDKIKAGTASGLMISHGYGGGTANMEFEGLTGLNLDYFSPTITVVNNEIVPAMRFIPTLSDFFKEKIAIHLENAENYNRRNVYNQMGYNEFITLANSNMLALDVENYGVHPSDASSYNQVIDNLTTDPQFFSLITIQNHSPWVDVDGHITAELAKAGKDVNKTLSNYVNSIAQTDTDTEEFLSQLVDAPKDISVVFYGDHLPGIYPQSAFEKNQNLKYQTDYFIWNNRKGFENGKPIVRTSDFIPELLELLDTKVSPWYALQTDHFDQVPNQQMLGAKGELTADQEKIVSDFKMIQYDLTVGKHYLKKDDSFFQVKK
ncbi:LTA synthase family protein [Streptococcaceae bacterium ESL0687]|nr:LTA synthase family protein [Streptococcaceae bacterium ESL0687]